MTMRLALAVVALGGCMKIYPSSELPDLEVYWYAGDCGSDTPEVAITLVGVDDGSLSERIVPCSDGELTIKDVDRVRYRVDGALLMADGTVFVTSSQEVDFRNGINQEASLYFPADAYLRITWQFANGESCASLGADTIDIDFLDPDFGGYTMSTSCISGAFVGYAYGNNLTARLRAVSLQETVAVSERSEPFTLMPPELVTVGPLTLVRCESACD